MTATPTMVAVRVGPPLSNSHMHATRMASSSVVLFRLLLFFLSFRWPNLVCHRVQLSLALFCDLLPSIVLILFDQVHRLQLHETVADDLAGAPGERVLPSPATELA